LADEKKRGVFREERWRQLSRVRAAPISDQGGRGKKKSEKKAHGEGKIVLRPISSGAVVNKRGFLEQCLAVGA